jgi:hypothetical protein
MASQIKQETVNTSTPTFEKWFENVFLNLEKELSDGPPIECIDIDGRYLTAGINDTGILFSDCDPHGRGENLMTGKPIGFVHMSSVYPYVHAGSRKGILAQHTNCFILPLCQLGSAPALVDMMNEAYSSFVYCIQGGVWHDISYIAHGLSLGLAAICYELCAEIAHTRQDTERMHFLVEALYCLSLTVRSAAMYSPECHRILTMMPYDVSADSLQAMLLTFIFDETPCEAIRVKQLGSAISHYFSKNCSLAAPYSPAYHLLIAPMLGSLLTIDISTDDIVNQITTAYKQSMESVFNLIKNAYIEQFTLDHNTLNKHVLCTFAMTAMASLVHFVRPELTDRIYDAVVNGSSDIASAICIQQHASFVNQVTGFTLNSILSKNPPILMQIQNNHNSSNFFATYCSTDPNNWSALTLRAGAKYIVRYTPLANLRPDTGVEYTSILRFTTGTEINSEYWYASVHDNSCSKSNTYHSNFFTVTSLMNGITVEHCDKIMLYIRNTDGRYLDPTLCFMNCTVSIEFVINLCEDQSLQDTIETIEIMDTSEIMPSQYAKLLTGQYTTSILNGTL